MQICGCGCGCAPVAALKASIHRPYAHLFQGPHPSHHKVHVHPYYPISHMKEKDSKEYNSRQWLQYDHLCN